MHAVTLRAILAVFALLATRSILAAAQTPQQQAGSEPRPPDITLLRRTCIDPDFAPHMRQRYNLAGLFKTLELLRRSSKQHFASLVVVRDGVVYNMSLATGPNQQPAPASRRVQALVAGIEAARVQWGLRLPDSVFLLNTWDMPMCHAPQDGLPSNCAAPVLSIIKSWDWSSGSSNYTDILMPGFNHIYKPVEGLVPWNQKTNKALMRAGIKGSMRWRSMRVRLMNLSRTPEGQELLDVGITSNHKSKLQVPLSEYMSIKDHAQWKYLLSTDGVTASSRFGKLLGVNSVVLKEQSPWIEYYYRALRPYKHFVPFNHHNILLLLQWLPHMGDERLQAIAQEAQHFQKHYLNHHAKVLYLQEVLHRYNQLFAPTGSLGRFVRSLNPKRLGDFRYVRAMIARHGRIQGDRRQQLNTVHHITIQHQVVQQHQPAHQQPQLHQQLSVLAAEQQQAVQWQQVEQLMQQQEQLMQQQQEEHAT